MADIPRVFLSYSHDSPEHKSAVAKLASDLKASGATVIIDEDEPFPTQGWPLWMMQQIEQADFVLVVCTETYRRRAEGKEDPPQGKGASWEGAIIRGDLYESNGHNEKFIPVVLRQEDQAHRPKFLREYSYFVSTGIESYQKLCKVLKLNTAPPPQNPQIWTIPAHNPYFSGRTQYLANLRTALTSTAQPAALTQAVKGLGGMGKTHTALKYADLHRGTYTHGFYTPADSRPALLSGFAAIALSLKLPGHEDPDLARAAAIGKRWFDLHQDWLLIFDNVEDWKVVAEWLPPGTNGRTNCHVIVTTRLNSTGTYAQGLDLPKMTPEEGAQFLLHRGKLPQPTELDRSSARDITIDMDGLPLALEQAGAYIEEAHVSPAEYLALYRQEGKKLRERSSDSADHDTVAVTFTLAIAKLPEATRQLITQAAFLAPDAIPEELLRDTPESNVAFHDDLTGAIRYSLLHRNATDRTVDIHRVLQAVVKDTLDEVACRDWVSRTADKLGRCFPDKVDFANWTQCERLLTHARLVGDDRSRFPTSVIRNIVAAYVA